MTNVKKQLTAIALLALTSGIAVPGDGSNRSASSPPGVQANPFTEAAYTLLADRVGANRVSFYAYQDADSGFNHGFPSGFFPNGAQNRTHLNSACIDDPNSVTGCSSDVNRLDRMRGNVLSILFDPQPPMTFSGIYIEEPEGYFGNPRGVGYDLRGATSVVFDIRSPTRGGVKVQFGVGGRVTSFFQIPQSSTYSTMSISLSTLIPSPPDLTEVHSLFAVITHNADAPNGGTVLLDNIRFLPVPTVQQSAAGFPIGNQTFGVVPRTSPAPGRVPFPPDQVLRNLATSYESAVTLQALLKRGTSQDLSGAQVIADAFVYALNHDNHGDLLPVAMDGSTGLHNGYETGDLALFNDQGAGQGQKGDVRLSGFTGNCLSGFCLLLDGASGGNNAFAILALAAAYKQFNNISYLNAAKKIGLWITGNLTDSTGTGYGGYYLGYDEKEFHHRNLATKGNQLRITRTSLQLSPCWQELSEGAARSLRPTNGRIELISQVIS